jgi:hypothetical protein
MLAGGLLVLVFVVRGRIVVDEFVFCATAVAESANTSEIVSIVLCGMTFLLAKFSSGPGHLNIA